MIDLQDNHDPLNEEARDFLKEGDKQIYKNNPVDAGVEYMLGRAVEPGNPLLKHRLETTRRYLVQRGQIENLMDMYQIRQGHQEKQAESTVVLAKPETGDTGEVDFFAQAQTGGPKKKKGKKYVHAPTA